MMRTETNLRRTFFVLTLLFIALPASAAIQIIESKGLVTVRTGKKLAQVEGKSLPHALNMGDEVTTGEDAKALIVFDDGAKVELSPKTTFTLEKKENRTLVDLAAGRIKSWVYAGMRGKFLVKTPAAVAAVRGTEFDVAYDKEMLVEVFDGLIAVQDLLGNEMLVAAGERLRIQAGKPLERPERMEGKLFDPKSQIEKEVALGMSKDDVQAAAAVEARLAEYQEGKTLIDVFGHRVRLEEYIVRPQADQFKLVALNERENRFDYFYYKGTFNKDLPTDLRAALKDVNGKTGTDAPEYYLTGYETGRSNTADTIQENSSGGHLVSAPLAEEKTVYRADTDSFLTVPAGTSLWQTLFDDYSYKVNGTERFGWAPLSGSNIAAYDYDSFKTRVSGTEIAKGGALCGSASACLTVEESLRSSTITKPDGANALHDRVSIDYRTVAGGPVVYSETYDFYTIDDGGKLALDSDFSGVLSGSSYMETLLKFNYEQVIRSSSFGDRSIDLVLEPKILIRSGLLQ